MKRLALMVGTLLLAAGLTAPALSAGQASPRSWSGGRSRPISLSAAAASEPRQGAPRALSRGARLYRDQGYLVPDQARYEQAKAAAARRAGQDQDAASPSPASVLEATGDPDVFLEWTGIRDPNVSPPDTTGAIGTSRYIELINDRFGIYSRTGSALSGGTLRSLVASNTDCVTDPQIMWDPQTKRFYYVVLEFSHFLGGCGGPPNSANRLYIGYSRTSSPSNASLSSWCKYVLNYFPGDFDALPDYPKLGDNSAFMLIGSNVFDNDSLEFLGADLAWITKPGPGSGCAGLSANHLPGPLQSSNGDPAFTPVPANQTDSGATGYLAAIPSFANNFIDTYAVSTNFADPVGPAISHAVAPFSPPSNAEQFGTTDVLDTLEGRLTQAISAFDPSKGKTALWTQHTVAGGGGSEVRWYEIDPAAVSAPMRSGTVTDPSLYVFNAAISPDRRVNGSSKLFGDAFVLGFNTSSVAEFVKVQMVSQWADKAMSGFVEVKRSRGPNDDFSCSPCRWGDYSGATPDPAASPYANHGQVWLSNQWVATGVDDQDVDWRTYNWGSHPAPFVVMGGPTKYQKMTTFPVSWELGNLAEAANVRYRQAPWDDTFGAPIPWQNQVPAGGANFTGATGNTYCFSAEALAPIPNSWGFTAERCAVVPLDDRDAPLVYSSGWTHPSGSGFFLNSYSRTTTKGKTITVTGAMAKNIYIMVEKCPTCGSINIRWNNVFQRTLSLVAGSVQKKVYLKAVSFASVQTGTLRIAVNSSGKPVIIDALAVSAV